VIAPDGSVVTSVPVRTQAYVDARVGLYDAVTPAVRIGPWLGRGCAGLVVLGWLLAWGQYRRTRGAVPAESATLTPTDRITA
jgi:apolipoprotein N-acyltransferase